MILLNALSPMLDLFRYYVGDISREVPAFAEGLPQIRDVPILLLNGTADTTTPVHLSRQLAGVLSGAELVEFEGVTHMGPMLLAKQAQPIFGQYVALLESLSHGSESEQRNNGAPEESNLKS